MFEAFSVVLQMRKIPSEGRRRERGERGEEVRKAETEREGEQTSVGLAHAHPN